MTAKWAGRAVVRARATVGSWLPAPCGKCNRTVEPGSPWVVGHVRSRAAYPELTWDVSNWRPEHKACSDRTGQAAVIEKARLEGASGVFSPEVEAGQPPLRPVSLRATGKPLETRSDLSWDAGRLSQSPWLIPYLDVPGDASAPLYMSPPPPDAVGSYGPEAIEWIEKVENKRLRWWQKLAVVRQLEHRADGSLVHRTLLESGPRRIGKSVKLRGLALWRLEKGAELFGETQLVMHTGSDVAICREIQQKAWRWAEDVAGWSVTRANGKEQIQSLSDDRWLVRSQDAVYGYDVTLALVDEGWNVKPGTVDEGLEPATMERSSAQVHLTSTAHRRATSLMKSALVDALTGTEGDPETLVLIWAAPFGSDPTDPAVHRAASPHWTEDRRKMIARKLEKALAGEVDPDADDPDPMAGFVAQYLNVWPLGLRGRQRGTPVVSETEWRALNAGPPPVALPDAAAIEAWFSDGVSLALSWRDGDRVLVSATEHADLPEAVEALGESGFTGYVTVGASLVDDPALKKVRKRKGQARTGATAGELSRLLAEGAVRHDGSEYLAKQVLDLRTMPGADGPRMVSHGRADAVKAIVWCITRTRLAPNGQLRIITASTD